MSAIDDAAERGAEQAGGVEDDRVERHGVRHIVRPDQFLDERLPRRVVERGRGAENGGEEVHVDQADMARGGEHGEHDGLAEHHRLRDDEQPPLRHAVGDHAAEEREQQDGKRLAGGEDAEGERGVGQRRTSHACAMRSIQVPTIETIWPHQKSR